MANFTPLKISIRLYCGDEIAMGPGKADLLDAIKMHGSISAAGRAMEMSYRRDRVDRQPVSQPAMDTGSHPV